LRPTEQDVVYWVWIVQQFLAVITLIRGGVGPQHASGAGTGLGSSPETAACRAVVLAWSALAVVLAAAQGVAVRRGVGPARRLVGASSVVRCPGDAPMVLLFIAIVELRRT